MHNVCMMPVFTKPVLVNYAVVHQFRMNSCSSTWLHVTAPADSNFLHHDIQALIFSNQSACAKTPCSSVPLCIPRLTQNKNKIAPSKDECLDFSGYRIYPKYSDTSTPYHICFKI